MTLLGSLALAFYRASTRAKHKCFSLLISGAFAQCGKKTVLMYPIRVTGEKRIEIGDRVFIGPGSWLHTLADQQYQYQSIAIHIGDGASIVGDCVISAVCKVYLEEDVLVARNVYISDHMHKHTETDVPILGQGVDKVKPVLVKRGAWLGQNVVVCPGVTIGRGAVIGANSVVNQDIPDFTIAAGAPAKVVKKLENAPCAGDTSAKTIDLCA
jgi:acetyltransferase-like isoleucine patch superfamily enzyme